MLKLHNKRGFAVIFDWIFSLVAGVLIFSFLIYFAIQHTDLFGKVTARVVAEELDVLFSGYETTESRSVLDFEKNVELKFKCDMDDGQMFTINNQGGKNLWGKIIFSPGKIDNDKVNVATMSWDVPFRVTNFVYLWDKKYTLIGEIPDMDFVDNFEITNDVNRASIRFVDDPGLSNGCSEDWGLKHQKVVYYQKNSDDHYFGEICFFEDNGVVSLSSFYGESMMIGAMFVDDVEYFECIKKVANNRLEILGNVYSQKANNLISIGGDCDKMGDYGRAKEGIDNLINNPFNPDFDEISRIESANDGLIEQGCVSVY